jgi:hypothetical protein
MKEQEIEFLERQIQTQKELIERIKERNPHDGELSFEYYTLYALEQELKRIKESK